LSNNGTIQIKEIAQRLGLSPGTVSLVLNGKGEAMRISKATQERVREAAKEMNYQPNINARRLRSSNEEEATKVIAVFWCTDFSDDTMGRFFKGIYRTVNEKEYKADFFIQLFDYDGLSKCKEIMTSNRFSGIIISGASDLDIQFLNDNNFDLPIILMNRNEQRYHCVYVNDYEVGNSSGRLFHARGHKTAGLISIKRKGHSVALRQLGYMEACSKLQIELKKEWIQEASGRDFAAGYEATKKVLEGVERPTALFVMSPGQVLGTVQACKDAGLAIPSDIEILTFGDGDVLPYYAPSISSIHIPVETTAENALNLLVLVLDNDIQMPMSRMLLAGYTFRESCGGFPEEEQ
jgi:DNA-binding LacI/PurR family transcriptional regulator